MNERYVSVRVRGDFALFTRPENKVERVSYPVMTPSAARGILEAIYWHPEFTWAIREIHVLSEVKTFGILRNEVNSKMSASRSEPYFSDEDRSQRFSVCLREVDYVIFADANPKSGNPGEHAKYRDIFRRRVDRGQCYHRPAFGCREFAVDFGPYDGAVKSIDWTEDLGLMLWDVTYPKGNHDTKGWHPHTLPPYWPTFFDAKIENGILRIPARPREAVA